MNLISMDKWSRMRDALVRDPSCHRFYSFKTDGGSYLDLTGKGTKNMYYASSDKGVLKMGSGRIDGVESVSLDEDVLLADRYGDTNGAFSVSVWIRPYGIGRRQVNDNFSGMITSSGTGYYDGWRLVIFDTARFMPTFEIGIGERSIGLTSKRPLCLGFWNSVVATWDKQEMRIYINGYLGASKKFSGPRVPAKGDLNVGFRHYGVGSLKMDADEIAIFNRALTSKEVVEISLLEKIKISDQDWETVENIQLTDTPEAFVTQLKNIISSQGNNQQFKLWLEILLVEKQLTQGAFADIVDKIAQLYQSSDAPPNLQGELCVDILNYLSYEDVMLPADILRQIISSIKLSGKDKLICYEALARSYVASKNKTGVKDAFEKLLLEKDLPVSEADVRLKYAMYLTQSGLIDSAAEQYDIVASQTESVNLKVVAMISKAAMLKDGGRYESAIATCETVLGIDGVMLYHKMEAEELKEQCLSLKNGKQITEFNADLPDLPETELTLFLATDGDDENSGTIEKPFATLDKARDVLREYRRKYGSLPKGGVRVYLRGGTYKMDSSFVLGKEDSGTTDAPVVFSAYKNETPVLTGGFKVKDLKKVDDEILARLRPEARGKVYQADLKEQGIRTLFRQQGYGFGIGNSKILSVYENGEFLQLARWPNEESVFVDKVFDDDNCTFGFNNSRVENWKNANELFVNGFWYHLWAEMALPVKSIDVVNNSVTVETFPQYGFKSGRPFYFMNLLEEIDQPGEWYIDTENGILYIWPKYKPMTKEIVVTELDKVIFEAVGVRNLIVEGIDFKYTQGEAILWVNCSDSAIIGCSFKGIGATALKVLDCRKVKIFGNSMRELNHGGMHVSGGDRKTLESSDIVVENNDVGYFGLSTKTYVPAVLMEGVGIKVSHNYFHHAPSSAIRVEGNNHLIEYNFVEFVVQKSDDQGGIDIWGDASYRGCIMRYNYWKDIYGSDIPCGVAGIRLDDAISGMFIFGNIFERTSRANFGGVQIHGGHMNYVENNLFVDCRYAVSFSPWDMKRFNNYVNNDIAYKLYKNVDIEKPPYSTSYPTLMYLKDPEKHNFNTVWCNIIKGAEKPWNNAPKNTDFLNNLEYIKFDVKDAARNIGTFRAIPVDKIGTYKHDRKARALNK